MKSPPLKNDADPTLDKLRARMYALPVRRPLPHDPLKGHARRAPGQS